jgi:hypothetical protein
MNAIAELIPLVAWDGGRRVAVAAAGAPPEAACSLIGHGPASSACVAVWEASAGTCLALLPDGTLHLDFAMSAPGRETITVPIELDAQLAPAMVDAEQAGLRRVALDGASLMLADGASAAPLAALNVISAGAGGSRLRAGPLVRADADDMVTTASAGLADGRLAIALDRHGGASPVLAALVPADAGALVGGAEDITGCAGADAARRGFALVAPSPDGRLDVAPFRSGDRLAVFAPRHHRIAAPGAARPGTRLVVSARDDGALELAVTAHAYRPATSTAMAALSGGGLAGAAEGGARDPIADAAAVAEAFWRRSRAGEAAAGGRLDGVEALLSPSASQPLARLTLSALRFQDTAVSPLMAAVGDALTFPPALIEEIEALSAADRAALAAWTAAAPETAAAAVQARVMPPPRAGASRDAAVAAVVAEAAGARPALRDLVERLALPDARMADREGLRAASDLAQTLGEVWTPVAELEAALALLARHPPPPSHSAVRKLLADLRKDAAEWSSAQAEARSADLGAIAEKRALIPMAALGAGLDAEAAAEIDQRLAEFTAEDIILLHRHLTRAGGRLAMIRGVKFAIQAMDAAAASGGLANRMDRSGDPLIGMTRIGSAAEPVMRELAGIPQAREALVALNTWINACVPAPEAGHAFSERLVRNLKSYGCFLLMHAAAAECRKLMEPGTEGALALSERLSSGLVETLPRFSAAAMARAGEDVRLGSSFTDRLPGLHGRSAP